MFHYLVEAYQGEGGGLNAILPFHFVYIRTEIFLGYLCLIIVPSPSQKQRLNFTFDSVDYFEALKTGSRTKQDINTNAKIAKRSIDDRPVFFFARNFLTGWFILYKINREIIYGKSLRT